MSHAAIALVLNVACGEQLYAGSDVVWVATHEQGDLAEWTGSYTSLDGTPAGNVEVSTEAAHGGQYSAKLSRDAAPAETGPGLYEDMRGLGLAYYAAWFLVPAQYVTASRWTIVKFRLRDPATNTAPAEGFDLDLRALPDGDYVLEAFDHDQEFLKEPVAVPPPIVRVGSWFQLEVRYHATGNADGSIVVWLDGRQLYRLDRHPTAAAGAFFSPCNVALDLSPSPAAIYVDDAAVSVTRITPGGVLRR